MEIICKQKYQFIATRCVSVNWSTLLGTYDNALVY